MVGKKKKRKKKCSKSERPYNICRLNMETEKSMPLLTLSEVTFARSIYYQLLIHVFVLLILEISICFGILSQSKIKTIMLQNKREVTFLNDAKIKTQLTKFVMHSLDVSVEVTKRQTQDNQEA